MTGCNGYVGRRLVQRLSSTSSSVLIIGADLHSDPHAAIAPHLDEYVSVDLGAGLQCKQVLMDVMMKRARRKEGKVVLEVVHLASFGMSGREQIARPERIRAVNVGGTEAVVEACIASGASLVYVSTVNVCFAGRTIENEPDIRDCYAPLDAHTDEYSRSKAMAEQLVLSRVRRSLALRLYGVYGEGEERHFPRMLR